MPDGRSPSLNSFTCPNCQALYHVVKVEAGPETVDRPLRCRACGEPLSSREGSFVLKYLMVGKSSQIRRGRMRLSRGSVEHEPTHDQGAGYKYQ
jgi:predicted Zn finger-like uncharacterized protein